MSWVCLEDMSQGAVIFVGSGKMLSMHFLMDCLEFQNYHEKLVRDVLAKEMVESVETLLGNKCVYKLVCEYVN